MYNTWQTDPRCLLVLTPFYDALPLSVRKTCILLLSNKMQQGWWDCAPIILLCYDSTLQGDLTESFSLLLLELKKQNVMNPTAAKSWMLSQEYTSREVAPSPAEQPDENPALADTLTSAFWNPKQRTWISHAQSSEPQNHEKEEK